jgi:5-deoxy-5-amino-3-dehydroquinate synthase
VTSVERVHVAVPGRPYDVVVGAGALAEVGRALAGRRQVAVVTPPELAATYAATTVEGIRAEGVDAVLVPMASGEAAKTLATVEKLCRAFAGVGLLRDDAVVAVGGGVVGDTAGFAASAYHRGVALVHVPTTLLAQVDSSIGGKTGVNLPEGKNLVGAFHQPLGVFADPLTLETLPEREFRVGLGEVAKYALMEGVRPEGARLGRLGGVGREVDEGDALVELLRLRTGDVLRRDVDTLVRLVARCVAIKAAVVAADTEERSGARAVLNYGHTLAHALETASSYELAHGEAVGIGLVFAGHLAHGLERVGPREVDRHQGVVAALGLPTTVPFEVRASDVVELMRRDKKSTGGLTFMLLGPDGIGRVDDPPDPALDTALAAVGVEV